MAMKKHIAIFGLRRSGTTITWETLRQDKRFLCFDEPFNFQIKYHCQAGTDNYKKTFREYLKYKDVILKYHDQIDIKDEANSFLKDDQKEYFKKLLTLNDRICMDITRCMLKVHDIKQISDEVFTVLLIRDVKAWISSQLKNKNPLDHQGGFNDYGYEIIFDKLFEREKSKLAYLNLNKVYNFLIGEAISKDFDYVLSFDNFCDHPEYYIKQIYRHIGLEYKQLDYSKIHTSNKADNEYDKRWQLMNVIN